MKRPLFFFIFCFLFCSTALAAGPDIFMAVPTSAPSCTTPTGDVLTESFGDASTSCWSGGPSTCNNTWTLSGTTTDISIVSSPGSPPSNTACANSINFTTSSTTAIATSPTFTSIPHTTPYDVYGTIYVTSTASGASLTLINASAASSQMSIQLNNVSGAYNLKGNGSVVSSALSISAGQWYVYRLHNDATAADSYLGVSTSGTPDSSCSGGAADTSTCKKFTAQANSTTKLVVGIQTSATANVTLGNAYVND